MSTATSDSDTTDTAGAAEVALAVEDVEFSYGPVQVLFGVSLTVHRGEALALLGTNGAGKSTLLRVIAGLARPTHGVVTLEGEQITGLPPHELPRRGMVLVPGGKAVFPDLTVDENLAVGAHLLRGSATLIETRIEHLVDVFPALGSRRGTQAGRLSGGEQQQLALAKALLLEPRILLIDELSLGLAPGVVETLLDAVRRCHALGTTIVLVEQSLNIAAAVCPRAIFLEKGAVRFEGVTSDLLERDDLARAVFFAEHEAPPKKGRSRRRVQAAAS